ncbi:hypothetical protein V6N13_072857 [Hibiscus sabdariffa]|uniref:Nop domain-containing protein n=1 Tax=Hibiscus sabdariffa TaxID=183260 RepID=A0ABR2E7D8_9ROSI
MNELINDPRAICVRTQLTELISGLVAQDLAPMSLGLSHSLSRYKLKFSVDKAVKLMGDCANATKFDFSEVLPEEVETGVKEKAVISMGTEINDLYPINIKELCDQVLNLSEYRVQLYDYLKSRMKTFAPNLSALVGELVGARLIAHGGSLLNLVKQPGSTVQILGAEMALLRQNIQLQNIGLYTMHPWLVRQHQSIRERFSGHLLQRLHWLFDVMLLEMTNITLW